MSLREVRHEERCNSMAPISRTRSLFRAGYLCDGLVAQRWPEQPRLWRCTSDCDMPLRKDEAGNGTGGKRPGGGRARRRRLVWKRRSVSIVLPLVEVRRLARDDD